MSQRRVWVGGSAAVTVLLIVASYLLLIHPKMSQTSDLQAQKASEQQANDQLRLDIAQLKAESASLPAKQAELAVIQQQLPATPNLPTLVRNFTTIANEAGVSLNSIAPSTPSAVPGSGSDAAATNGLFAVPVSVIVQGDFASSDLFVQKLQTEMRRAFLVQSITVGKPTQPPGSTTAPPNGYVSLTLAGDVFVLQPTAAPSTTTAGSTTAGSTTAKPASGSAN